MLSSVTADPSRPLSDAVASRVGFYSMRVSLGERWRDATLSVPGASLKNTTTYQVKMRLRSSVPMRISVVCVSADGSALTAVRSQVLAVANTSLHFTEQSIARVTVGEPCGLGLQQDRPGLWWLDSGMQVHGEGGADVSLTATLAETTVGRP